VFIVTGHPEGPVIALDQDTGERVWQCQGQREASNRGWSSPIFVRRGSSKLVIAQTAWHVLGIDADDGTVYWEEQILGPGKNYDVGNALCNIPVYVDGRLFCTTGYGPVVWTTFDLSADGKSVKKVWNNPAIHPHQEGVVCVDGMLFGTGDVTWEDFDANPKLLVNGSHCENGPIRNSPRRQMIDRPSGRNVSSALTTASPAVGTPVGLFART
jgi:outer membrane protein assembly factor BamB